MTANFETPESLVIAKDLKEKIVEAAAGSNKKAESCLKGLLLGDTIIESGKKVKISMAYVKILRSRVRQKARDVIRKEAA